VSRGRCCLGIRVLITYLFDLRGISKMRLVPFSIGHEALSIGQRHIIIVIFLFDVVGFEIPVGGEAPHIQMAMMYLKTSTK